MTTYKNLTCPTCGASLRLYANPSPTVDIIIALPGGIVLVRRKNPPFGWALPGGFVDYGETVECAARREAKEETGLDVVLTGLLGVYSDPHRDPRQHTISTVFVGQAQGKPCGGDDAERAEIFPLEALPEDLAFDHREILEDYKEFMEGRRAVCPQGP